MISNGDAATILVWVLLAIVVLVLLLIRRYEKLLEKAEAELRLLRWFDHRIPINARFYFDRPVDRKCRRCRRGDIKWRFRYQLVELPEGGTTVRELARIYWCTGCSFRGLSLK